MYYILSIQSLPSSIRKRNACSYLYVRLNLILSTGKFPANHPDSTRNTLATVAALAGLGLAALNVNSKVDAAKKSKVPVAAPGQSFALGGCERSGRSSFTVEIEALCLMCLLLLTSLCNIGGGV